uniref:Fused compound leaf 1 n=1 Tax=Populus trichocarpa TaxID=3694 RepID=G9J1M4_POPTR|nr:fused compound leaf 1 [Populus trichocarpa]
MESSSMNNTVGKDDDLLVDTAEAEALKKRISSHPLYGLLVQTHIDCLKVGTVGDVDRIPRVRPNLSCQFPNPSSLSQPELDSFMVSHTLPYNKSLVKSNMEAYCFALSKLKEAMEEPQQETVAFINSMHLQLKELTRTHSKSTAEHSTSTTSSEMQMLEQHPLVGMGVNDGIYINKPSYLF